MHLGMFANEIQVRVMRGDREVYSRIMDLGHTSLLPDIRNMAPDSVTWHAREINDSEFTLHPPTRRWEPVRR